MENFEVNIIINIIKSKQCRQVSYQRNEEKKKKKKNQAGDMQ